jgi:DNA-binding HxlR family transcriptional regulator
MDTVEHNDALKPMRFSEYDCGAGCPVEAALEQISGKWKGLAIYHLLSGTQRFSNLKRNVGSVTQRSLTKQLRELEADGIVERTVYAVVPPKVEYYLTEKASVFHRLLRHCARGGWQTLLK